MNKRVLSVVSAVFFLVSVPAFADLVIKTNADKPKEPPCNCDQSKKPATTSKPAPVATVTKPSATASVTAKPSAEPSVAVPVPSASVKPASSAAPTPSATPVPSATPQPEAPVVVAPAKDLNPVRVFGFQPQAGFVFLRSFANSRPATYTGGFVGFGTDLLLDEKSQTRLNARVAMTFDSKGVGLLTRLGLGWTIGDSGWEVGPGFSFMAVDLDKNKNVAALYLTGDFQASKRFNSGLTMNLGVIPVGTELHGSGSGKFTVGGFASIGYEF